MSGGGAISELPRVDQKGKDEKWKTLRPFIPVEFDEAFEVFSNGGSIIKENLPLFLK